MLKIFNTSKQMEEKIKVYAHYLGQPFQFKYLDQEQWNTGLKLNTLHLSNFQSNKSYKIRLFLRTIDQLKGNEAKEMWEIVNGQRWKHLPEDYKSILVTQYMYSKGIDFPQFELNGLTCIEAGIAIRHEFKERVF